MWVLFLLSLPKKRKCLCKINTKYFFVSPPCSVLHQSLNVAFHSYSNIYYSAHERTASSRFQRKLQPDDSKLNTFCPLANANPVKVFITELPAAQGQNPSAPLDHDHGEPEDFAAIRFCLLFGFSVGNQSFRRNFIGRPLHRFET